ncbi:MAG: 4Fe-4S binding protein [Candidatus Aenigmatarchaeota archaeon]
MTFINEKETKPAKLTQKKPEPVSAKRFQEFRPVLNKAACAKCMACFVFCPDTAISKDPKGFPKFDFDVCKGCLVCLRECPERAINEERVK